MTSFWVHWQENLEESNIFGGDKKLSELKISTLKSCLLTPKWCQSFFPNSLKETKTFFGEKYSFCVVFSQNDFGTVDLSTKYCEISWTTKSTHPMLLLSCWRLNVILLINFDTWYTHFWWVCKPESMFQICYPQSPKIKRKSQKLLSSFFKRRFTHLILWLAPNGGYWKKFCLWVRWNIFLWGGRSSAPNLLPLLSHFSSKSQRSTKTQKHPLFNFQAWLGGIWGSLIEQSADSMIGRSPKNTSRPDVECAYELGSIEKIPLNGSFHF